MIRRPFRSRSMRWLLASFGSIGLVVLATPAAQAAPLTTVVTDPAGDARLRAPDYLDIVRVEVAKSRETFTFTQAEAGSFPAEAPLVQPGTKELWWAWGIDTDPLTAPSGFPFQFLPRPVEFIVLVFSDGVTYSGVLIDRRPLLSDGAVVVTPIPFSVSGSEVRADVAARDLGDPPSFLFASSIDMWSSSRFPTEGFNVVDTLSPFLNAWPS